MQKIMQLIYKFFFIYSLYAVTALYEENAVQRHGKFWEIGLVRFANGLCGGEDNLQGTCFTRRECARVGGTRAGSCASGLGVCCVVQATCGDRTSSNNTYFVSPDFPRTYPGSGSCTLTIQKCAPDICQVRIDFLTLSLAQPDAAGNCFTDALYVTGGASVVPVICGDNTGQHIYVDFNDDQDIQITINTNAATLLSRSWNIKIAQIGCACPTRAPAGCLMYYTSLSGTVRSFNYGTNGRANGTRQLVNENYGVCVAMQPGYCSIQWSESSGDPYAFTVSGDTNAAIGDGTIGTASAALSGTNCTTDFVVIPNPVFDNGTSSNTDRFCGNGFSTVTTSSKPFVLTVVTNGDEAMDAANRGFSLSYSQQRCNTMMLG